MYPPQFPTSKQTSVADKVSVLPYYCYAVHFQHLFTLTFRPSPPDLPIVVEWTLLITSISSFASELDLSNGRHQGKSRAQENNVGVLISLTPPLLTAHVIRVGWPYLTTEDHLPLHQVGGGWWWFLMIRADLRVPPGLR